MRKPEHHEHAKEIAGASEAETQQAVDAAIRFSRESGAIWDELLAQAANSDCGKKQSCIPIQSE
jgi:hypothetical protein